MFFQDLIAYFFSWIRTRSWKRTFWGLAPILLVLFMAFSLVFAGWIRDPDQVRAEYLAVAQKRDQDDSEKTGSAEEEALKLLEGEELSPIAELSFRRVLQSGANNQALFTVSAYFARTGRLKLARQMMRKMAPRGEQGYGLAHAWLAEDRLSQSQSGEVVLSPQEFEVLKNDLLVACRTEHAPPNLVLKFCNILKREERSEEALKWLAEYSVAYPRLNVNRAWLALKMKRDTEVKIASSEAISFLQKSLAEDPSDLTSIRDLALSYYARGQLDEAINSCRLGLELARKNPDSSEKNQQAALKIGEVLSGAFFDKFRQSKVVNDKGQVQLNLDYLDLAIQANPNNEYAQATIANLMQQGAASPEMAASLNATIAAGKASATTHLIVGNYHMTNGERANAINHFRIAKEKRPDNPIVLNNLAYLLAEEDAGRKEALDMIDEALTSEVPITTSLLDTKGSILMKMGKYHEAITAFQDAIRRDPLKVVSMENLVQCYETLEMDELAATQKQRVEEVKVFLEKRRIAEERAAEEARKQMAKSESLEDAESAEETKEAENSEEETDAGPTVSDSENKDPK